jgi:PAS domain S-box-containing protein
MENQEPLCGLCEQPIRAGEELGEAHNGRTPEHRLRAHRECVRWSQAILRGLGPECTRQTSLPGPAPEGILIHDVASVITYWSTGAAAMYGWTEAEAHGQVVSELLRAEYPQPLAEIEAAIMRDAYWHGELVHTRRDGTRLRVASHWALQCDEHSQPRAIFQWNTDVGARRRLEAEHAARAQLEGVLLAARTMEHELNNQLTPTVGYTALLAADPALPAHLRRAATQAFRGATEAGRTLARLMQLTALQEKQWGAELAPTIDLERSSA